MWMIKYVAAYLDIKKVTNQKPGTQKIRWKGQWKIDQCISFVLTIKIRKNETSDEYE